jgi:hypothetical protein
MNREQSQVPKERASKWYKTTVSEVNMVHTPKPDAQAGPLGTPTPEDLVEDSEDTLLGPSPQVKQAMQQTSSKSGSRPRARQVTQKDPL